MSMNIFIFLLVLWNINVSVLHPVVGTYHN